MHHNVTVTQSKVNLQYVKILTVDKENKKLRKKNLERICQGQKLVLVPAFAFLTMHASRLSFNYYLPICLISEGKNTRCLLQEKAAKDSAFTFKE